MTALAILGLPRATKGRPTYRVVIITPGPQSHTILSFSAPEECDAALLQCTQRGF
jgi:hypothetical protein